jgi:putative ubiquitin-RnfH superfamily antitoxin RatB of RatAB toxin-antitoxin module
MIEEEAVAPASADIGGAGQMRVQVCYATPVVQFLCDLQVAAGTTLEQAIVQSGLLQQVPDIDLATAAVGIYAKKKPLDTVLREHDRIEVYRPLIADPKEARRRRANRKSGNI